MGKLKIAVCDDEAASSNIIADAVVGVFRQHNMETDISIFNSARQLDWELQEKVFDLLFLDIAMPGMDGLTFGKKLRNENDQTDIIFVSSREDKVFESFKVSPVCFIRKSHLLQDIPDAVMLYLKKRRSEGEKLIIKTKEGMMAVPVERIAYIEGGRNCQIIHMHGDESGVEIRRSMQELETELEEYGFIRVHKGFLVNCDYIELIDSAVVHLKGGGKVPLSRRKVQNVKKQYLLLMQDKNFSVL